MSELTADLFVTLDGFASGEDVGPYFGYGGPDLDSWIRANLEPPQVVLMGRVTYKALSGFLPSATDDISMRLNALPKIVFSNTLKEPLAWSNTRLMNGDLPEQIRSLKQQSSDPIRTFGSIALVKGLIQLGLVDRLRLMVFPLILGSAGSEPIFADYPRTDPQLIRTEVLDSRLVLLEYRP